MLPYSRQWIDEEDIEEVVRVLRSGFITQGPKPKEFEEKLAEYCGADYCVVFNSGTSALHAAYFTAGLKEGDEFITSPVSFVATANAGLYLGARPAFADVEQDTGNIDVSGLNELVTEKTKLIIPVHYSGHPADIEAIYHMARERGITVIEDACHALGAKYKGEMTGSCKYSDMAIFSFHPVKHIATGEGGAVTTNSKSHYEKLIMFRSHGITKEKLSGTPDGDWYYEMHFLGYNYRMSDIQAALGISQMKKLDGFVKQRRKIADIYNNAFRGNAYFDLPPERDYAASSYHLYPVRLKTAWRDRKKGIFAALRKSGLGVQVHYIPIYRQPYYKSAGYKSTCPRAEDFYRAELSIPLFPVMSDEDINYVITKVIETFRQADRDEAGS